MEKKYLERMLELVEKLQKDLDGKEGALTSIGIAERFGELKGYIHGGIEAFNTINKYVDDATKKDQGV